MRCQVRVNSRALQAIVGVSQGTIVKWCQAGMPFTGGRGTGKRLDFDLALVTEWIKAEGRPKAKYLRHIDKHAGQAPDPVTENAIRVASEIHEQIEAASTPAHLADLLRRIMQESVDPTSGFNAADAEPLRRQVDSLRAVMKLEATHAARDKEDPLLVRSIAMDREEYEAFQAYRRQQRPAPLKPGESVPPPVAPKGRDDGD